MKKYTKEHLWVRENENGTFDVGVTDYVPSEIGSIQFGDFPEAGRYCIKDDVLCTLEATKSVMQFKAPFSGKCIRSMKCDDAQKLSEFPMDVPFATFKDASGFEGMTEDEYAEYISNGQR